VKRILILTAGFGEGHNSAARGIRDGLAHIAPSATQVEVHDLFAETYGLANDWARVAYLSVIDRAPQIWGVVYRWLDRERRFAGNFKVFFTLKHQLTRLLARFRPDLIVCVYPAYPHMLDEMLGPADGASYKRVVVITDSISVNAIWYRCSSDYFLLPNETSASILHSAGIAKEKTRAFGFPVSPRFAEVNDTRLPPSDEHGRRVLYIINGAKPTAPELVRRLAAVPSIQLTVTTGRDARLFRSVEQVRESSGRSFEIINWSDDLPRLLRSTHLVISKAGGATVQEAIAASCPMIINHIIPGQEEGNARLITETNSGAVALTHDKLLDEVQRAFADDAALWRSWSANVAQLSRPAASLQIAEFLLSL
jgi:processive 1,2-diacylglycerol beta-glucosyltransferase